jgi:hypothetical protein
MMLGEESKSATYWKKCGDEALANGVKHVVMMVSYTARFIFYISPYKVVDILQSHREHIGRR